MSLCDTPQAQSLWALRHHLTYMVLSVPDAIKTFPISLWVRVGNAGKCTTERIQEVEQRREQLPREHFRP